VVLLRESGKSGKDETKKEIHGAIVAEVGADGTGLQKQPFSGESKKIEGKKRERSKREKTFQVLNAENRRKDFRKERRKTGLLIASQGEERTRSKGEGTKECREKSMNLRRGENG